MNRIIEYEEFLENLKMKLFNNSKADLINKLAANPNRFIGIFRPTSPEVKLIQNLTQSHEISFGDFIEDIVTQYLGNYYNNLPKVAAYKGEQIMFDQLFEYNNTIYMIEQKMRDDHDSTKKRGQFDNFLKKIEYLKMTYPNNNIEACMWFVDNSLKKNRKFYLSEIQKNNNIGVSLNLFYGAEFTNYLDKTRVWDELNEYLLRWKMAEDNKIELNFEKDWEETKTELLEYVPKKVWKKLMKNQVVVDKILPILFPTAKYKEILEILDIEV